MSASSKPPLTYCVIPHMASRSKQICFFSWAGRGAGGRRGEQMTEMDCERANRWAGAFPFNDRTAVELYLKKTHLGPSATRRALIAALSQLNQMLTAVAVSRTVTKVIKPRCSGSFRCRICS
jgi:hypothetical protein